VLRSSCEATLSFFGLALPEVVGHCVGRGRRGARRDRRRPVLQRDLAIETHALGEALLVHVVPSLVDFEVEQRVVVGGVDDEPIVVDVTVGELVLALKLGHLRVAVGDALRRVRDTTTVDLAEDLRVEQTAHAADDHTKAGVLGAALVVARIEGRIKACIQCIDQISEVHHEDVGIRGGLSVLLRGHLSSPCDCQVNDKTKERCDDLFYTSSSLQLQAGAEVESESKGLVRAHKRAKRVRSHGPLLT